jgi:hypothetical protein
MKLTQLSKLRTAAAAFALAIAGGAVTAQDAVELT